MFSTLVASKPKREGRYGFLAGFGSILLHGLVVAVLVWVTMNVGQAEETEEVVMNIFPVEEEAPPPPPPPPPPPMEEAPPVVEMEEPPLGFQTLSPPSVILPDIPPPTANTQFDARDFSGEGVEGGRATGSREVTVEDIDAAPRFTPYTVRPEIRNMDEVSRALQRFYPPILRDAGIGGTVVVWFRINEQGEVIRTQLHQSSGHDQLDNAALRVGEVMQFTPAMNRDQRVAVWIQLPITFRATDR
jgi:protein TonB